MKCAEAMPIPAVSKFRFPLLKLLGSGKDYPLADAASALADEFSLTSEERTAGIPSSGYRVVRHRTGWAGFHLRKAALVFDGMHGVLRITPEGKALLAKNPTDLSEKVLLQFPKNSVEIRQAWKVFLR